MGGKNIPSSRVVGFRGGGGGRRRWGWGEGGDGRGHIRDALQLTSEGMRTHTVQLNTDMCTTWTRTQLHTKIVDTQTTHGHTYKLSNYGLTNRGRITQIIAHSIHGHTHHNTHKSRTHKHHSNTQKNHGHTQKQRQTVSIHTRKPWTHTTHETKPLRYKHKTLWVMRTHNRTHNKARTNRKRYRYRWSRLDPYYENNYYRGP